MKLLVFGPAAPPVDRAGPPPGLAGDPRGNDPGPPRALWGKVLYNAALNPLSALLGVPYGALAEDPGMRNLMGAVVEEAFAVARARKVALDWPSAAVYPEVFYGVFGPRTRAHRASMWADLERRGRTEIDALNGRIAEYGRALGVPTPVNEMLSAMVRLRERWMEHARQGAES